MPGSITGGSAIFLLSISDLFPAPVQLQGFSVDDVFDTDPIESVEVQMGVDGHLARGFVYKEVKQNIALQADSISNAMFDQWWGQMQQSVGSVGMYAQGTIILTALGTKWSMVNGALTSYTPIPTTKRLIQPRRFGITWESVTNALT